MGQEKIYQLLIFIVPLLFSLSFHEAAHAWMAKRKGDRTAELLGRLTLNPIAHIDIFGTVLFPAILILSGSGVLFGWAKPVPVNPLNLKHYRQDNLMISLAGPVSNLILAVAFALALHTLAGMGIVGSGGFLRPLTLMLYYGVALNLALAFFNLLPIPPLDGSHILAGLLQERHAQLIDRYQQMGFLVLIVLLMSGVLRYLWYPIQFCMNLLLAGVV